MSRLLLVDDDPALLSILPDNLRLHIDDLQVDAVSSGAEALGHLQRTNYDAIVTGGRSVFFRIEQVWKAAHDLQPETPLLVLWGATDSRFAELAHAAGVDTIITKPFNREAVANWVRQSIAIRRLREDLLHARSETRDLTEQMRTHLRFAREEMARLRANLRKLSSNEPE